MMPEARVASGYPCGVASIGDLQVHRFGERALLLGVEAQADLHVIAEALVEELRAGGLEDVVPADRSLLVAFDGTDAGERALRRSIERAVARISDEGLAPAASTARHRTIPVMYGGADGPDLDSTARLAGISSREFVEFHTGRDLTVQFLGFAPGFAYLGDVSAEIVVPRLVSPRTRTPAGSVAVAEAYSGIYPADLPGGWRVIGWTPVLLFDPAAELPTYLLPGDTVRFEAVGAGDRPAEPYRPADWAR